MPIASGLSAQLGIAEELYVNEVQQISGTPSGAFSLIFDGAQTTLSGLATNASAANVQAALEALPNIGTGNVACAGGALPTAITITFSGSTVSKRNVPAVTVGQGVTGVTVATNTPGTGYGDPQTVTRFFEFTSESLALSIDRLETAGIRATNRFQRTDRWAPGKRQVGGDFEIEVPSKGFSMLLGQLMGSDPIITTPSGGTATRDHTVTVGDDTNRSTTIQLGTPDISGNVQPFTYVGTKFTDWEFSCQLDGLMMLKATTDAQNEVTTTGLAVAAYPATYEMLYWAGTGTGGGGSCTIGGANVDIRSFKITGKQKYATDRFFLRANTTAGGASLKKEPVANGLAEITGEIELEFDALTNYNRFVNGTTAALVLQVEGSIIEAGGGATVNPRVGLQFTFPFARFDGDTPDVKDADITTLSLKFKALWDGSTQPVTARYRTTDTAK